MNKSLCKMETDRMISSPKRCQNRWMEGWYSRMATNGIWRYIQLFDFEESFCRQRNERLQITGQLQLFIKAVLSVKFFIFTTGLISNQKCPSHKVNSEFHNACVFCDVIGTILKRRCPYITGNSKTYNHEAPVLWKTELRPYG